MQIPSWGVEYNDNGYPVYNGTPVFRGADGSYYSSASEASSVSAPNTAAPTTQPATQSTTPGTTWVANPYMPVQTSTSESGSPIYNDGMWGASGEVMPEAGKTVPVDQYGWYVNPYEDGIGPGTMYNASKPGVYAPAGTQITADYKGVPVPERESGWLSNPISSALYKGSTAVGNAVDYGMEQGMGSVTKTVGPYIAPAALATIAVLSGGAAGAAGAAAGGGMMGAAAGAGVGAVAGGTTALASSQGDWGAAGMGALTGAVGGGYAGGMAAPLSGSNAYLGDMYYGMTEAELANLYNTPNYAGYGGDLSGLSGFEFNPNVDYTPYSGMLAPGELPGDIGAWGGNIDAAAAMQGATQGAGSAYPGLGLDGMLDGAGQGMRETLGDASQADIDYGANLGAQSLYPDLSAPSNIDYSKLVKPGLKLASTLLGGGGMMAGGYGTGAGGAGGSGSGLTQSAQMRSYVQPQMPQIMAQRTKPKTWQEVAEETRKAQRGYYGDGGILA